MDQADIADQFITEHLERAVAAARGIRNRNHAPSTTHCLDCGDRIPEKRRKAIAGCNRCISCAEDHEKRQMNITVNRYSENSDNDLIEDVLLAESMQ
jgi:phage/conjugal plasmid C-4 type zinc finger TraR family protein